MNQINKYLDRESFDSIVILLSKIYKIDAYDIKQVIEQVDSIDDALIILHEYNIGNISLKEGVYLRLKGIDNESV